MSRIRNRRDNNQRRLVYNEADGLSIDLNKPREQLRYECIPQDKLYLEDAVEHTVLHLKAVIDERDELRENLILADIGRRQVSVGSRGYLWAQKNPPLPDNLINNRKCMVWFTKCLCDKEENSKKNPLMTCLDPPCRW